MIRTLRITIPALLLASFTALAETQTVTLLTDDGDETCDATCTLRDALLAATISPGPSEVRFQGGLAGTITLASKLTVNGDDITVIGPGPRLLSVSGDDQFVTLEISSNSDNFAMRSLTIRDGFAEGTSGAGIAVLGTNVLLENLRVIDNHHTSQGGGINMGGGGAIRNVEISGNSANVVSALLINGSLPVLVENVTISGNTATGANGAVRILTNTGQDVILRYVTIANNTGGQITLNTSNFGDGTTTVESSIVFGNSVSNAQASISSDTLVNNSIIGSLIDPPIEMGENNLVGVDPGLLPLGFISSSDTQVHRFAEDSPAFGHVDNGVGDPMCGTGVTNDQVGNPRPGGAQCDAGAYEVRPGVLIDDGFE